MSKYRYISAVGQINGMACWAASLKWWYKAAMSISASQQLLWDRYSAKATQQGGLPDSDMKFLINENGMKLISFPVASTFTAENVSNLLAVGPVFTAYTELSTGKRHVNVIYEMTDTEFYTELKVMEPQATSLGGGKWGGKHEKKSLTEFNTNGSVWTGVHRGKYNEWLES